eukprot:gene20372-1941_t
MRAYQDSAPDASTRVPIVRRSFMTALRKDPGDLSNASILSFLSKMGIREMTVSCMLDNCHLHLASDNGRSGRAVEWRWLCLMAMYWAFRSCDVGQWRQMLCTLALHDDEIGRRRTARSPKEPNRRGAGRGPAMQGEQHGGDGSDHGGPAITELFATVENVLAALGQMWRLPAGPKQKLNNDPAAIEALFSSNPASRSPR